MEDFSVLMGRPGDKKYQGRYESLLRASNLYTIDITRMYEQIVLSLIIGNGDAHLKNFAITYQEISGPFKLSPIYDVVCTRAYGDVTTALSVNQSREYPRRAYLEKLGNQFGVREPREILDRIAEAVDKVCSDFAETLISLNAQAIKTSILKNRDLVLAR
jgi:serine/threonine-protein kinase HipA